MGVRFPGVGSNVAVNANLGNNVETVVLTTPPLTLPLDLAQVFLQFYVALTAGAATTTIQARLRRGSGAGGTIINGQPNFTWAAAAFALISGCWVDTPGAVAGQQYTLTLVAVNSTAPSPITDACMIAYAL